MQSLRPNPDAIYQNVSHALKTISKKEGARTVIRGVNIVIAGAGPAHAVYFASYEVARKSLGNVRSSSGQNNPIANGKMNMRAIYFIAIYNKRNMHSCFYCRAFLVKL